jgi:hypothetical protein
MPGTGKYYQEHYVDMQRDHVVKIIKGDSIVATLQIANGVITLGWVNSVIPGNSGVNYITLETKDAS